MKPGINEKVPNIQVVGIRMARNFKRVKYSMFPHLLWTVDARTENNSIRLGTSGAIPQRSKQVLIGWPRISKKSQIFNVSPSSQDL